MSEDLGCDEEEGRAFAALLPRQLLALLVALATLAVHADIVVAADLPANFFGFQFTPSALGSASEMEAVARSGAKYWRMGFGCDESFAALDSSVRLAWEHGLTVIANPASCNGSTQYPAYNYKSPSAQWENWENWLWQLVQHYGYGGSFWNGKANPLPISIWELWNEPNRGINNPGGFEAQPQEYAKFLKRSAGALTEAQGTSNITVLMGGLISICSWTSCGEQSEDGANRRNLSVHDFLQGTKEVPETGSKFNGMALHPYGFRHCASPPSPCEAATHVEQNIATARENLSGIYSSGKAIWITEVGWPVNGWPNEKEERETFVPLTPEEQATALNTVFNWVESYWEPQFDNIQSLLYYFYRDENWDNGKWDGFTGLRSRPGNPFEAPTFRPAWYTYQNYTGAARWPVPASAETGAAVNVQRRSATLAGSVNPHGLPTHYHFNWGTTTGYGHVNPSAGTEVGWEEGPHAESETIYSLTPNTTYHYQIAATNENAESSYGGDVQFTTPPAPPLVTTEGADHVEVASETGKATLHGQVDPEGFSTEYRFEWGTEPGKFTHVEPMCGVGSSESYQPAEETIEGLHGSQTYYYRLFAQSSEGQTAGGEAHFATPDWSPAVTTGAAEELSPHIYRLHATIDPKGFATSYGFEYGEGKALGATVVGEASLTGSGPQQISLEVEGLKGEREYSFRAFATSEGNGAPQTNAGSTASFVTPSYLPAISEVHATGVATYESEGFTNASKATLRGLIDPLARDTHYRFRFGPSGSRLRETIPVPDGDVGAGAENVAVEQTVEGLLPETTYSFILVSENEEGESESEVETFTTPEWALLESPGPGEAATSDLQGVSCTAGAECIAVGDYVDGGGSTHALAERRDGGFSVLEVPEPAEASWAQLEAVSCAAPSGCVAVGRYWGASGAEHPLAETWDGSQWSISSPAIPGEAANAYLKGVSCVAQDACVAAGYYTDESGVPHTLVESWDGHEWAIVESPDPAPKNYLSDVSCANAEDCWAVGRSTYSKGEGKSPEALLEHYAGGHWSAKALPEGPEVLTAISCPSTLSCTALVGEGLSVWRYYEGEWNVRSAAEAPGGGGALNAISCTSATACTATGYYANEEHTAPLAERWDGGEWKLATLTDPFGLIEGVTSSALRAVSCSSSSACTAVGYDSHAKERHALAEAHRPGPAPTATTGVASAIATPEATLRGTVNPNGEDTSYQFQYVTDATCREDMEAAGEETEEACFKGAATAPASPKGVGSGTNDVAVSTRVGGLQAKTAYRFRLVAESGKGTTFGKEASFTTREWSLTPTVNPAPRTEDTLTATSCPTQATCIATGYNAFTHEGFAEAGSGTEWQPAGSVPGEIAGISCSTETSCRAIGEEGGELRAWRVIESGGTWRLTGRLAGAPITPEGASYAALDAISCSSESACTAVGAYYVEGQGTKPLVERYDGEEWSLQSAPAPPGGGGEKVMLAVSCATEFSCVAVGEAGEAPFVERWDGFEEEWTIETAPAPEGARSSILEAVSCASSKSCMAVGHSIGEDGRHYALVLHRSAGSWSLSETPTPEEAPGGEDLYGVSCTSGTSCVAVGRAISKEEEGKPNFHRILEERTLAESYDGSGWTVEQTPNPESTPFSALAAVSCPSEVACTAVGTAYPGQAYAGEESLTLGERLEGGEWSLTPTVNPAPRTEDTLTATSCPTQATCIATGYNAFTHEGFAEAGSGTEWQPAGSVPGEIAGISCSTETSCRAIGEEGGELRAWRVIESGGTWRLTGRLAGAPITPEGASYAALDAISCSSESACTAVGAYYVEGQGTKPLVERYDGEEWSLQSAPAPPGGGGEKVMLAVSCATEFSCVAVGEAGEAPFVERWDGFEEEWTIETAPAPEGARSSILEAVSCASSKSCMAVGHSIGEDGRHYALVLHRSAGSWSLSETPTPEEAPGGEDLYGVSCTSGTSCVAVGRAISKEEEGKPNFHRILEERTLAESYDGSGWTVEQTPNPESTPFSALAAVSCPSEVACTAVGTAYPGQAYAGEESLTLGERYE